MRVRSRLASAYVGISLRRSQRFRPIRRLSRSESGDRTVGSDAPHFESRLAYQHLQQQCALGPRFAGSPGHALTRDFIVRHLLTHATSVGVQEWQQLLPRWAGAGRKVGMTNIFALVRGTADTGLAIDEIRPDWMLATHWDTRPLADQDPDPRARGRPVPGANDGASGVAVLLEAARALSIQPPARSLILAFFDGEDLGYFYYGSRFYSRHVNRSPIAPWRAARGIVIDMVGRRGVSLNTEVNSLEMAPAVWEEVLDEARSTGFEPLFGGPRRRINDDHIMLNRAGIPAVLLIDYSDPHWHTTHDTPEKCDPESLGAVGQLLLTLARRESGKPGGPAPRPTMGGV